MPAENAQATRMARAEITKRLIDSSMLEVRCIGTVCHLTGILRKLRTHPEVDLKEEMQHISHILRSKAGIREVVWETIIKHN